MGTVFQVPWTRLNAWPADIDVLRGAGFVTAALALGGCAGKSELDHDEIPIDQVPAAVRAAFDEAYPGAKVKWVQDEPFNQGPWPSYHLNVVPQLGREVEPVTRAASSTTAVGTAKRHLEEAKVLIGQAFA